MSTDDQETVETEPQFGPVALSVLGVILAVGVILAGRWISDMAGSAAVESVTDSGGQMVATTVSYPFAAGVARILAGAGIAAVALGAWLQAASMRRAVIRRPVVNDMSSAAAGTGVAVAVKETVVALGEAIKHLKAPVAMLLVGAVLLLTAGFIAAESIPGQPVVSNPPATTTTASTSG